MSKFRVILADPPWHFSCWSDKASRHAQRHYKTQGADWIASLPVADVAAEDCCLFLWVTFPNLKECIAAMEAWGFEYKTCGFTWVKSYANGNPLMGLGYWTRSNAELCLLGTRGKPKRMDKGVSQVIVSGTGEHSEKPEEVYSRIERLVEGPYLEMFHRPRNGLFPPRPNWTFIGNETTGRDIRDDLDRLAKGQPL